jgi:hypothetical protein
VRGTIKDENGKFQLRAKRQIATPIPGEGIKVTRKARNGKKVRIFVAMTSRESPAGQIKIEPYKKTKADGNGQL